MRTVGEEATYINRQLHKSNAVSFLNTDKRNEEHLLRVCFPRASHCAEPLTHVIACNPHTNHEGRGLYDAHFPVGEVRQPAGLEPGQRYTQRAWGR